MTRASLSLICLALVVTADSGCGGAGEHTGHDGSVTADAFSCGIGCFFDVLASCEPSGSCKTASLPNGVTSCYANGVRESATSAPMSTSTTVWATKPDGTTCWSYEIPHFGRGATPETLEVTYKDSAGRAFGTVMLVRATDGPLRAVSITCPGESPQQLNPRCILDMYGASGLAPDGSQRCSPGRCP
jgi:hypothetical protein